MDNNSRKPNWTDYANLAANVLQVSQLGSMNRELHYMRSAAADEQRRTEIEDQRRDIAFQIETLIDSTIQGTDENPAAALLMGFILRNKLAVAGILPSAFRAYEDKQRVQKIQGKVADLIAEINMRHPDVVSETEKCDRFFGEFPELQELILATKKVEAHGEPKEVQKLLTEKTQALQNLDSEQGNQGCSATVACVVLGSLGGCIIGGSDSDAIGIGILVGILGGLIIFGVSQQRSRRDQIQNEIAELQQKLEALPEPRSLKELRSAFGKKSIEQYLVMWKERRERVRKIIALNIPEMPLFTEDEVEEEEEEEDEESF